MLILWSIIAFILALSILVIFHEFGHFIVARAFGIKVLKFSVGFGKSLWSFYDKRGTEYCLAMIPLGGYVKMLDENEMKVAHSDRHLAFNRKPVLVRMAVVVAGPLFNLLLAVVMFWLMFVIGIKSVAPIVGKVDPNSVAQRAGLHEGDEVIAINGAATPGWNDVNMAILAHLGKKERLSVEVQTIDTHKTREVFLNLKPHELDHSGELFVLGNIGIHQYIPRVAPIIGEVKPNEPGWRAGLKPGDRVISVAEKSIDNWAQLVNAIDLYAGQAVNIKVMRQQHVYQLLLKPEKKFDDHRGFIGYIGVHSPSFQWPSSFLRVQQYSLLSAWWPAVIKTWGTIKLTAILLVKMLSGEMSSQAISGPIGIAQGAGISANLGLSYFLDFLGLMSVSLGILNLLPIPILDGGHLLYYLYEFVRGKPLSQTIQAIGMRFGLILLLALMVLAFYNDILRLFT